MSVASATRGNIHGLPEELRIAQEAIERPEVQAMLRELAKYNLGISMPHMHDEETGAFLPLPSGVVQVEEGLEVSFRPAEQVEDRRDKFVPVAWAWRGDGPAVMSQCYSLCEKTHEGGMHVWKHRRQD